MKILASSATGILFAALGSAAYVQANETATATFIDADGAEVGTATLSETPHGVLIEVDLSGIEPGEHGFHIHGTGACEAEGGFQSAGGHYNPAGTEHGYVPEGGHHAGDMPNQFVEDDGILLAHVFNPSVTLGDGEATLFDDDGSAIVLHQGSDDYESQPSGDAGDRLACAVIEREE